MRRFRRPAHCGGLRHTLNALCHHNLMLDVDEAIEHVGKLLGYTSDENRQWARDTIDKLTARMADEG